MSSCCCSLAGTAACRYCTNNPYAETPPPVRTYTTIVTDGVLITGQKTNADRIRQMTDKELARYIDKHFTEAPWCNSPPADCPPHETCRLCILDWLKSPAKEGD